MAAAPAVAADAPFAPAFNGGGSAVMSGPAAIAFLFVTAFVLVTIACAIRLAQ
jgi:hypothetical protein